MLDSQVQAVVYENIPLVSVNGTDSECHLPTIDEESQVTSSAATDTLLINVDHDLVNEGVHLIDEESIEDTDEFRIDRETELTKNDESAMSLQENSTTDNSSISIVLDNVLAKDNDAVELLNDSTVTSYNEYSNTLEDAVAILTDTFELNSNDLLITPVIENERDTVTSDVGLTDENVLTYHLKSIEETIADLNEEMQRMNDALDEVRDEADTVVTLIDATNEIYNDSIASSSSTEDISTSLIDV